MATRLYEILTFENVPAGEQATLAHHINVNEIPYTPDFIFPGVGGFELVSGNETSITIQNDGSEAATIQIALWLIYSPERLFGQGITHLTPRPFWVSGGSAGGGTEPALTKLVNDSPNPMIIGTPVYSDASGGMNLAVADNSGKATVVGLVADPTIAAGAAGNVCVAGLFEATADQWDAICGTAGGLAFNTPYYLDPVTPGRLTSVAPVAPGQQVTQVMTGLSATKARIAIQPPILL